MPTPPRAVQNQLGQYKLRNKSGGGWAIQLRPNRGGCLIAEEEIRNVSIFIELRAAAADAILITQSIASPPKKSRGILRYGKGGYYGHIVIKH